MCKLLKVWRDNEETNAYCDRMKHAQWRCESAMIGPVTQKSVLRIGVLNVDSFNNVMNLIVYINVHLKKMMSFQ